MQQCRPVNLGPVFPGVQGEACRPSGDAEHRIDRLPVRQHRSDIGLPKDDGTGRVPFTKVGLQSSLHDVGPRWRLVGPLVSGSSLYQPHLDTRSFGAKLCKTCASLDRHHLLGIKPVIDPISPMLHQLRARANQRERSVLLVETFHGRVVEMRELQLDDIPIPCLGVLNFLMVRQRREGGPESMGTMISFGVNAKKPQALVERVV